jgi:hypothetical protein
MEASTSVMVAAPPRNRVITSSKRPFRSMQNHIAGRSLQAMHSAIAVSTSPCFPVVLCSSRLPPGA